MDRYMFVVDTDQFSPEFMQELFDYVQPTQSHPLYNTLEMRQVDFQDITNYKNMCALITPADIALGMPIDATALCSVGIFLTGNPTEAAISYFKSRCSEFVNQFKGPGGDDIMILGFRVITESIIEHSEVV